MTRASPNIFILLFFSGVLWSCVLCLQRPAPRYSQQYMPDTSFTCRNKIIGSYYADPETDCQLFHVCVSVAGYVQDYRFLCPNDTAFDQESQTCADWYDVDCEAATLYYASDNFDLYRIGSGLESLHFDSIRSDAEPQDHLQRSESNDPVRSPVNRVSASFKDTNNYFNKKNSKDTTYEEEKSFRQDSSQDTKKKTTSSNRKVSRKQQQQDSTSSPPPQSPSKSQQRNFPTTTVKPSSSSTQQAFYQQQRHNNHNYNSYTTTTTSTTSRPTTSSYSTYSTYRPSSNNNNNNNNNNNYNNNDNYQTTTAKAANYNNFNYNQYSTTVKPPSAKSSESYSPYTQSTTVAPSSSSSGSNLFPYGFQQRTYNSVPRVGGSSTVYPSTTVGTAFYDSFHSDSNSFKSSAAPSAKFQTVTSKYYSNGGHPANNYSPTTYSPVTKKSSADEKKRPTEAHSTNYYASSESPKKTTKYTNYEKSAKYYESSTSNYDFARSSAAAAIGFSPSSINHLAESPRTTTPTPRRAISTAAYSANDYEFNSRRGSQARTTAARGTTYVSESARPFSTTAKFTDGTTPRPKSTKKNDYDYAYYDNAGPAEEYEGLDLEHVAGNKESAKLTRN